MGLSREKLSLRGRLGKESKVLCKEGFFSSAFSHIFFSAFEPEKTHQMVSIKNGLLN